LTNYDDESSSSSGDCCIGSLDELLCQSSHDDRAVKRVHRAALTFRHAIHSFGFQSKFLASHHDDFESTDNNNDDDNDTLKSPSTTSLYEGYIQTHTMMKLTNYLRASPLQLCQQSCTQTWPGQLSLVQNNHHNNNNHNDNNNNDEVVHNAVVTCLNSAEVWCDHPSCKHARCGPNGVCLRAYRFLPSSSSVVVVGPHNNRQRDVRRTNVGDLNGPGDINGTWSNNNNNMQMLILIMIGIRICHLSNVIGARYHIAMNILQIEGGTNVMNVNCHHVYNVQVRYFQCCAIHQYKFVM
jgi:hypothetical protein